MPRRRGWGGVPLRRGPCPGGEHVSKQAGPAPGSALTNGSDLPILQAGGIEKSFKVRGGDRLRGNPEVKVLDDISLSVKRGESLGLVGESGCGKSTLARCLLRLLDLSDGSVKFDGTDLQSLGAKQLRALRRRMQFVFQDPYASLDPRMSALQIVEEPLQIHEVGDAEERRQKALEMLVEVGLTKAQAKRRPHAFSGGQRQRIGIARAFVLHPELVILDEPVSALDVSVQAQVLNLLRRLQKELGLTYVFITHDLAVAEYFCDRVAVLYVGQVMEIADRRALFHQPLHPYSVSLLSVVPVPAAGGRKRRASRPPLIGEVGSVVERPAGCPFEPRCPVGRGKDICKGQRPALTKPAEGHWVACHFPGEATAARGVAETPASNPKTSPQIDQSPRQLHEGGEQ
ncbi:MAG: ATP-binding cassette domain-containing protein [Actinobacteria bacterium]|nr:ATP-binding cassette domain-containing protein [Actinomycetota bacterium]